MQASPSTATKSDDYRKIYFKEEEQKKVIATIPPSPDIVDSPACFLSNLPACKKLRNPGSRTGNLRQETDISDQTDAANLARQCEGASSKQTVGNPCTRH